jgi:uncharacterized protein YdhG (YjbR/CyaY superfamily)
MATTTKSGFSAEERAAMKERAKELKAAQNRESGLAAVREAIEKMSGLDAQLAQGLHDLVTEVAPFLEPRTWYGFPAYFQDGKNVVFFKPAEKFHDRYATLGFEQNAQLDDGTMWPTSYALTAWNDANSAEIARLLKKATAAS